VGDASGREQIRQEKALHKAEADAQIPDSF
jgi:hypothetical protein